MVDDMDKNFIVVCDFPEAHKMYKVIGKPCGCLPPFRKHLRKTMKGLADAFWYGESDIKPIPTVLAIPCTIPYEDVRLK